MRWTDPYLETCCRSALHRLVLAGETGRPPTEKDAPCLARLSGMDLAVLRPDGRYVPTPSGLARHDTEILGHSAALEATEAGIRPGGLTAG